MTTEFIQKILRLFICGLMFLCCLNFFNILTRELHQVIFILFSYVLFSLLLRNIWLTLFMWLTVFLFSFFKFNGGQVYLTNVFAGCIFYYLTKLAFTKEHIDYFVRILLWVLVANLLYGIVQVAGFDFIYSSAEMSYYKIKDLLLFNVHTPIGFMGNSGCMAIFIAFCLPFVATRRHKYSTYIALLLFIPLLMLRSSTALFGAITALLFVLFFKCRRKIFYSALGACLIVMSCFFLMKVDKLGTERFSQWQIVLSDCNVHPITGWGLDSFRSITNVKKQQYVALNANKNLDQWDNPHNLFISLLFEFGLLSLFLLGGYVRQCVIWFAQAKKDYNTIALAGFILSFFVVSIGWFPMFLARLAVIIIPCFALYEINTRT